MNDYRELRIDITPCSEDGTDVMAYLLAEAGFESFVPDEKGLTAYIKDEDFNPVTINDALAAYPFAAGLNVSTKKIEGRDWNSEWEKNYFRPIVVGNRCVIHSSFHPDVPEAEYDIVIDPKMAFGTGHHATTSQVIEALLDLDLGNCTIIDMGTGTGILSIVSALHGAEHSFGIEIDEFAYLNAKENVSLNHVENSVTLFHGDASALGKCNKADVFIANINRNIIIEDLPKYVDSLNDEAVMILSGFYEKDIPAIMGKAAPFGLKEIRHTVNNEWACLILKFKAPK